MSDYSLQELVIGAVIVLGLLVAITLFSPDTGLPETVTIAPEKNLDVAVLPFTDATNYRERVSQSEQDLGEKLRPYVESEITNTVGVAVYTRTKLDEVTQEQVRGAKGLIDSETAVEIGELTGVKAIVTGKVLSFTSGMEEITRSETTMIRRAVEINIQFQVINAETGQITASDTLNWTTSATADQGDAAPKLDPLVQDNLKYMAERTASHVEGEMTREFSYGTFKDMEPKGDWIKGVEQSTSFTRKDGQIVLLFHFEKMRPGDNIKVEWLNPDGTVVHTYTHTYENPSWDYDKLGLQSVKLGNWKLEGYVNGKQLFDYHFAVQKAPEESEE